MYLLPISDTDFFFFFFWISNFKEFFYPLLVVLKNDSSWKKFIETTSIMDLVWKILSNLCIDSHQIFSPFFSLFNIFVLVGFRSQCQRTIGAPWMRPQPMNSVDPENRDFFYFCSWHLLLDKFVYKFLSSIFATPTCLPPFAPFLYPFCFSF